LGGGGGGGGGGGLPTQVRALNSSFIHLPVRVGALSGCGQEECSVGARVRGPAGGCIQLGSAVHCRTQIVVLQGAFKFRLGVEISEST
jgi:hypothetical protein